MVYIQPFYLYSDLQDIIIYPTSIGQKNDDSKLRIKNVKKHIFYFHFKYLL